MLLYINISIIFGGSLASMIDNDNMVEFFFFFFVNFLKMLIMAAAKFKLRQNECMEQ